MVAEWVKLICSNSLVQIVSFRRSEFELLTRTHFVELTVKLMFPWLLMAETDRFSRHSSHDNIVSWYMTLNGDKCAINLSTLQNQCRNSLSIENCSNRQIMNASVCINIYLYNNIYAICFQG